MVLEQIIPFKKIERKQLLATTLGFIYATFSIFVSLFVFESQSSLLMVFFTAFAAFPFFYIEIIKEEKKDLFYEKERKLLKEHARTLEAFLFLFLGATLAFTFWYTILDSATISTLFQHQTSTIQRINSNVTGFTFESLERFSRIFFNNIRVLFFCILFSFLYGAGAIFILIWNSSVIGAAIGNFIRLETAKISSLFGLEKTANYFHTISYGLLKYVIHGIPEILGYFTAALAGGIISVAIIRHDFKSKKFECVVLDSADLIIISFILIFLAAVLEVWVTPLIF